MGNGMHEKLTTISGTFATECSQLVEMVSELEEWPAFASYLEDINSLRESFFPSKDYLCTKNAEQEGG